MAQVMWLIIALAMTFSICAALWVGHLAREIILQQHIRRLALETDQFSSDLGQSVTERVDAVRVDAVRAAGPAGDPQQAFDKLLTTYPQLGWLAMADAAGRVIGTQSSLRIGTNVAESPWFGAALTGPWLGTIADPVITAASREPTLGDLAIPVRDERGQLIGVVCARLSWRRTPAGPRLIDDPDPRTAAQAVVLDRNGVVIVGPNGERGRAWSGTPTDTSPQKDAPRFERLPNGEHVLVARAPLSAASALATLGWQVQLSEPNERVYQRGNALAIQILWVAMALGCATAVVGALGARQLTRRLKRLTMSVASLDRSDTAQIEVPPGRDEVARLGRAFAAILSDLRQERRELKLLSGELERRVEVRTREVARLAEESRYAAVVRERLQIARDLHDTLAHSMMAMLSEVRFLRKLQAREPDSVAAELSRAEHIAHEGLKEARTAIEQIRGHQVRDTGLGSALSKVFEQFINHTGLTGDFSADPESARFGDERAEVILRMAQEALRNIERHAEATHVIVGLRMSGDGHLELRIEDNGVGFDPGKLHAGHFGIVGLREQAELIDAHLCIDSRQNEGAAVIITLRVGPVKFEPEFQASSNSSVRQ